MPEQPSALSGAFRRPFREQVEFFRQKLGKLVPTRRWDDLTGAAHDTAFMVAGAQKADLLADLAASVDRAIAEGQSLEAFRKDFAAAVDKHDWHGWTGEGTKAGEAWRTRTIYRTNTYVSYAAGRRAQLEAAGWNFWIYVHGGSKDPRPEHLYVFNGLVLPPDHPFWDKHYPPSDWGCSCYVVGARSERGAARLSGVPGKTLPEGWDKVDPKTGEPAGVGKGWGYAPGASVAQAIVEKVKNWPEPIAQAFRAEMAKQLSLPLPEPRQPAVTSVDRLSPAERQAITGYTGPDYRPINAALRDEGRLTPQAKIIADALGRASFEEDVVLYRGLRDEGARQIREEANEEGDGFKDEAFASTSRLREKAEQFRSADPLGVLLIIRRSKGAKALDVKAISTYPEEEEVLFQHATWMVVERWDPVSRVAEVFIDDAQD